MSAVAVETTTGSVTEVEVTELTKAQARIIELEAELARNEKFMAQNNLFHGSPMSIRTSVKVKSIKLPKIDESDISLESIEKVRLNLMDVAIANLAAADALVPSDDGTSIRYGRRVVGCHGSTIVDQFKAMKVMKDGILFKS